MNREEHAKIAQAYLMRMPLKRLAQIYRASKGTWEEQANGNMGSQLQAHKDLINAIDGAVTCMTDHDLDICETIVKGANHA